MDLMRLLGTSLVILFRFRHGLWGQAGESANRIGFRV